MKNQQKSKVSFGEFFQGIGKTFMLPVALLGFMGFLLGVGSAFSSASTLQILPFLDIPFLQLIFRFMSQIGGFAFSNLPVMFAMAIPLGLVRHEKGIAAFSGFVGYMVMLLSVNFYLTETNTLATAEAMKTAGQSMTLGVQSIEMGVLGGMITGIIVYLIHEKNYNRKLPDAFAFFGGVRFVPIASACVMSIVGIILTLVWPILSMGINGIGSLISHSGIFAPFLFGAGERLLLPFGLHHILVALVRFTQVGGTMFVDGQQVSGALNIFYAQLADPSTTHFSVEATRFLSQGKMPSFMFGLPAIALAIYHTAKPENRGQIKGLLISGVLASLVTGITEPIEFLFLFISPLLYGIHAVLTGLGFMVMGLLHVTIGNTDGGLIDFVVFGILQGTKTNWWLVPIVGAVWFAVYYFVFRTVIVKFDLETPGREKVATAAVNNDETVATPVVEDTNLSNALKGLDPKSTEYKAAKILYGLGGKSNITNLDNCITRLRLSVADMSKVNDAVIKECKVLGIVKLDDHNLQVIIGPQVGSVKQAMEELM